MSNLSLKHRELLSQRYDIGREAPVQSLRSTDGTIKYLFRVGGDDFVETVYIPDRDRATLCVVAGGLQDELQFLHDRKTGF